MFWLLPNFFSKSSRLFQQNCPFVDVAEAAAALRSMIPNVFYDRLHCH